MRLSRSIKLLFISFLLIAPLKLVGQNGNGSSLNRSDNYYMYPVSPGRTNTLAGTMGELRSTHFHSGIDVRTGGVQGKPVHASADGYISRINISPGGYGNALYLTHPNGQTTVYAHLRNLNPQLQEYVRTQQYQKQSFRVNLFPQKGQFTFNRGDTIAYSGNSGSSGGPHLHFDIRDRNQKVLNPLKFGFREIIDTRAPEARLIALKTMTKGSRINGQFGKFDFALQRRGNTFTTLSPIKAFGKIGIELYAFDRQDYTRFRTGIYRITMTIDGYLAFEQTIDTYAFSEGRNFYAHVNYDEIKTTGRRYHRLYVGDGNELSFYKTNHDKGVLTFTDDCEHLIEIIMEDSYGNKSKVELNVECQRPGMDVATGSNPDKMDANDYEIIDNTLVVYAQQPEDQAITPATFYIDNNSFSAEPDYIINKEFSVFLWDMRDGIPDSVDLCFSKAYFPYDASIPSHTRYTYYDKNVEIEFRPKTLFDTAYLDIGYQSDFLEKNELFRIGDDIYPFRQSMKVTITPEKEYDYQKAQVYQVDDQGNFYYTGGEWNKGKISFYTRNFGQYTILEDSVPPSIKPLIINSEKLVFRIRDDLSGIKEFRMEVDGDWVLMNYDPKLSRIWSEKLDPEKPFQGTLVLTVSDLSNNVRTYKTKIN